MEAYTLSVDNIILALQSNNENDTQSNIYYWWDGIRFVEGQYIKYPHPDRDHYGISPYRNWTTLGDKLLHCQIDQRTSRFLRDVPGPAVGAAIGAIIGEYIGGPVGTAVGVIVGVILGAVLGPVIIGEYLDEWNCIWWWTSQEFLNWLTKNSLIIAFLTLLNPRSALRFTMHGFLLYGYLRVGPTPSTTL